MKNAALIVLVLFAVLAICMIYSALGSADLIPLRHRPQ